jgi:RimJ/RimL family protein N-acetyltransferase
LANIANTQIETIPEFNPKEHITVGDYNGESEAIAELYHKTYDIQPGYALTQLSYPYPEALDPIWIDKTARNQRKTLWKVVKNTLDGQVIGSVTIQLDRENKRGYVRGMMIDPAYQGKKVGGRAYSDAFRDIMGRKENREVIKIFWTENRTAHSGSQRISEALNFYPLGLFPNKDVFLGKRESDLLYAVYAMNTLKLRRPDPQLIREVLPIYKAVASQFRFPQIQPVDVSSNPPKDQPLDQTQEDQEDQEDQVQGSIVPDEYEYGRCMFCMKGEVLTLKLNPRTCVAEEALFSPKINPTILKTLVQFALDVLDPILYYIEFYVSAYQPELQQVFADLGFSATGYAPGWNLVGGQREDMILFSWVREPPSRVVMNLTDRASKVVQVALDKVSGGDTL